MTRPPFDCMLLCFCFLASLATVANAHEGEENHKHSHAQPNPDVLTTRTDAKVIPPTVDDDAFQFLIYGDRTGGVPAGLKVLEQAVVDSNLLDPDLVMTVGDLIQGYNENEEWLEQADEYKVIMNRLKMRWFPVAGNHDIYWRGKTPPPPGHHESNYEKHFGPLWYSFRHKNAGFIVLYSDEGDPKTNLKAFNTGALQQMSEKQLAFLDQALLDHADQDHIFVFLHHPRWIGGGYTGSNWDTVHDKLKQAGNVSAVFAGHIHRMRYDGAKDGIEYYALATTGGHLSGDTPIPDAGLLHHFNVVTVREKRVTVSSLAVGAVFDPKRFTPEFLADVGLAKSISLKQLSKPIALFVDGSAKGTVRCKVSNPSSRPVDITAQLSVETLQDQWRSTLDHKHMSLEPGQSETFEFLLRRDAASEENNIREVRSLPSISLSTRYMGSDVAVDLPAKNQTIGLKLTEVPADYFRSATNQALLVDGEETAVGIANSAFTLPDGPFTVETWVKPKKDDNFSAIATKTQSSEYGLWSDHGSVKFDVNLNGKYVTAAAPSSIPLNQWTHIAGVFDGNQVALFINGKQVAANAGRGKRSTNRLPLYLGGDPNQAGIPTRPFTGLLDEFRLSTGVRYRSDFQPQRRFEPDDRTVLLHHFDRSVGPFLLDHSTSAANGRLGKASKLVPVQ